MPLRSRGRWWGVLDIYRATPGQWSGEELPVHYAKMDRSFIAGLPDDARSRALVNAVIVLARGLELGVIGEGVETPQQRDYLTAAGCQYVQGYHLARPMPAEEIHALLATQPRH